MIKLVLLSILVACGDHGNRAAKAIGAIDPDVKCDDWSRGPADKSYCEAAGYLLRCVTGDDGKPQCKQVADLREVDKPAKPDAPKQAEAPKPPEAPKP